MFAVRTVATRTIASAAAVGAVASAIVGVGTADAAPGPKLTVTTVASGLKVPWGVVVAPDGTILTNERSGRFVAIKPGAARQQVRADLPNLYVSGEAGLMGMALDANFAQNRRLYTCQSEAVGSGGNVKVPQAIARQPIPWPSTGQDTKVVAWQVDSGFTKLTRERTVLSGIPVTTAGREAGCAVTAGADGTLWIGTGDNGLPTLSQDKRSLGGKVLHINTDGTPARGNPNPASPIYTLGHRNVQNIAFDHAGRVYSIEQGTHVDDELNLLRAGGNYGFRPDAKAPLNDNNAPMTDPRVRGAIPAVWSSGNPTIATPAITFLPASGWGTWNNAVVISALKGKKLIFAQLSADGKRVVRSAEALSGEYGRLRGTAIDRDGSLLLLTNNRTDDKVLRVRLAQ